MASQGSPNLKPTGSPDCSEPGSPEGRPRTSTTLRSGHSTVNYAVDPGHVVSRRGRGRPSAPGDAEPDLEALRLAANTALRPAGCIWCTCATTSSGAPNSRLGLARRTEFGASGVTPTATTADSDSAETVHAGSNPPAGPPAVAVAVGLLLLWLSLRARRLGMRKARLTASHRPPSRRRFGIRYV